MLEHGRSVERAAGVLANSLDRAVDKVYIVLAVGLGGVSISILAIAISALIILAKG
jgi:hypothetical protein